MVGSIKIAALLTCFNRKAMTVSCLQKLMRARDLYNEKNEDKIVMSVFLTDDKCTDGTPDAVRECMKSEDLHIIEADGNAFWAGGMRLAWKKAIETDNYDFYLLLNDDTIVWENVFNELFICHDYAIRHYGKGGIYSGNTSWFKDKTKITFGGKVAGNGLFARYYRLNPNGSPQKCDIVNANILLVSHNVVETIGIFPDCYIHGAADNDYGMRTNNAGLPVLITPGFCGSCDADNYNYYLEMKKLSSMTLMSRIHYFNFPVRSIHDSLAFSVRWRKRMVPIILFLHCIQIISPFLYYQIFNYRKKCNFNVTVR